ncbi:indole-3-glycerol-phosphate synthase [Methanosphaera cuniculi]|uniref:Indole-3-glycerol phosphate synthase n=1 Tax=Methanosphaera cuniculi TaxID=1077256 RepID=A0A2A2HC29_9EURY|nr:indole-3-glycerol-phosphate synthase [Methanosphaera cuniculi]PAV07061.1 indole-3-glycerol-phosphate synthase TrpC [Methanosphaera cuniculi]PWL07575.1 indole-3-glycerol phosphate synthase [Methanosphaera cuniculi]
MNVVDEIVKNKKQLLKNKSADEIKQKAHDYASTNDKKFRFQEKLSDATSTKLICEYKPASPSQGDISTLSVEDVIEIYDTTPVDMISVLTEESYFKSNIENLKKAVKLTDKPVLRKDFIIDEYMIYEAVLCGASAVLLINGVCPDIEDYLNLCHELGIDAIVECHTLNDIEDVIEYDPKIIGINNRDFKDLSIDLETTKKLSEYIPNYMISESGVKTEHDARKLRNYGADGVLIGTSVLKSNEKPEIEHYINKIKHVLRKNTL